MSADETSPGERSEPAQPVDVSTPTTPVSEGTVSPTPPPNQAAFDQWLQINASISTSAIMLPLPPPEMLNAWKKTIPDVGDRFLRLLEEERRRRWEREEKQLQAEIDDQKAQRAETKRGQLCALAIGLGVPLIGAYAAINGAPATGAILGTGGLVALVTAFLRRRSLSDKPK